MTRPLADALHQAARPARSGPFARLLQRALSRLSRGSITLRDRGTELVFGAGEPAAVVTVHDPAFYRRAALGGSVGAGESYMDGDWDCDGLVALVRILAANRDALERLDGAGRVAARTADLLAHLLRANTRRGSRRNIEAHYDLSNAFFETFLDERMMYSAAVYESPAMTLEEASRAKLERLCRKLELAPEDHLLEIGTGWGGLAVYAAGRFGCRVTTATISPSQYEAALDRVRAAGLEDRVEVLLTDYRDLTGRYDKLVSVEMVEAVGNDFLNGYFETLSRLVRPGGLIALQAITIEDRRFRQALRDVDFIKKHVFPGSFIPSVSRLVSAAARHTDTVLVNLEDIGLDYADTLAAWRERFEGARRRVLELGFDERFLRLWRFYLCYCEGGFRERAISDVQLLFAKPGYRRRPWRAGVNLPGGELTVVDGDLDGPAAAGSRSERTR
ncbi:MAG: SAM-dependent methyltransferase [Gammaproteobacteria bacterium]|nr:SAM-dependent methyltransferase [Gammaproteobacteria bacterium]